MHTTILLVFAALVGGICLIWLLRTWRTQPTPPPPAFVFCATTRVRAYNTTNLHFSVPCPPNFHHETQPTITRDFVAAKQGRSHATQAAAAEDHARLMTAQDAPVPQPDALLVSPFPIADQTSPRRPGLRIRPISSPSTHTGVAGPALSEAAASHASGSNHDEAGRDILDGASRGRLASPLQHSIPLFLVRMVNQRPDTQDPSQIVKTYWFEVRGQSVVQQPPNFVQDDVEIGEILYHRNMAEGRLSQLWIWVDDRGTGPYWKPVTVGYRRQDGRRLSLSEKRKTPSWVHADYFTRRSIERVGSVSELGWEWSSRVDMRRKTSWLKRKSDSRRASLTEQSTPPGYQLSSVAIEQLSRIGSDDDEDASLREAKYKDALEELAKLNSCNAALFKAVLDIQRTQKSFGHHITQIDEEIVTMKNSMETSLHPVRLSHCQSTGSLRGERRSMEVFRAQSINDILCLQKKVKQLELENGKLRNQVGGTKNDVCAVHTVLSSIQLWAGHTDTALEQLEGDAIRLCVAIEELQDSRDPAHLLHLPDPYATGDAYSLASSSSRKSLPSIQSLPSTSKSPPSTTSSPSPSAKPPSSPSTGSPSSQARVCSPARCSESGSPNTASLAAELADASWYSASNHVASAPQSCARDAASSPKLLGSDVARVEIPSPPHERATTTVRSAVASTDSDPKSTNDPKSTGDTKSTSDTKSPRRAAAARTPSANRLEDGTPLSAHERVNTSPFGFNTAHFVKLFRTIVFARMEYASYIKNPETATQENSRASVEHRVRQALAKYSEARRELQIALMLLFVCIIYGMVELVWYVCWRQDKVQAAGSSSEHPIWEAAMREL
ncbi:hypothetical protein C8Q80DRAFT_1118244 [Daedaleopsis nitida]|nr:hypothetical protein C8Q80DRAFT_1118244 [Daedaleopsis nitida]